MRLHTPLPTFFHLDRKYINPITSAELNQAAKRPPRTGFIIDKAMRDLEYRPHTLKEGLEIIAVQLKQKELESPKAV